MFTTSQNYVKDVQHLFQLIFYSEMLPLNKMIKDFWDTLYMYGLRNIVFCVSQRYCEP